VGDDVVFAGSTPVWGSAGGLPYLGRRVPKGPVGRPATRRRIPGSSQTGVRTSTTYPSSRPPAPATSLGGSVVQRRSLVSYDWYDVGID
jgi:hypothetical protein